MSLKRCELPYAIDKVRWQIESFEGLRFFSLSIANLLEDLGPSFRHPPALSVLPEGAWPLQL